MNAYNKIEGILIRVIEHLGDELEIEFRKGTDSMDREYKTDEEARNHLYRILDLYKVELGQAIGQSNSDAYITGRNEIQAQLRDLLGVKQ